MDENILLNRVLEELRQIKLGLPDLDKKQVTTTLEKVEKDIRELKILLLDPEDGVIVKVNKNTGFRLEEEEKFERNLEQIGDIKELKQWKDTITKILWIIFTSIIGLGVKLLFYMDR